MYDSGGLSMYMRLRLVRDGVPHQSHQRLLASLTMPYVPDCMN